MKVKVNKVTICITQADILTVNADILVHSTNPMLSLAPWLDKIADTTLRSELTEIGWCDIGSAVLTSGANLPYNHIVHAVPPKWGEGSERGKLANATWSVLVLADENGGKRVVMPPLASGAEGYPVENCAKTMLEQILDYTFEPIKTLRELTICASSALELTVFINEFERQLRQLNSPNGFVRAK